MKRFVAAIMTFLLLAVSVMPSLAQQGVLPGETTATNPKDRTVTVQAEVVGSVAPLAPSLVAPSNGALLTGGVVVFEWTQSLAEGGAALDRFELYLNGTLLYGPIHTTNQTTDNYILTVTNGNQYRLQLQQDKWLPDGAYFWRMRVVDVNDRGSDSATWAFTIDSTAPNILITEVDGQITAISASDQNSLPAQPLIVSRSSPEIVGQTEAGSELELTITFLDGSSQRYRVTAGSDGSFIFFLSDLPANQNMALSITATDLAGLTRTLEGVSLVYRPRTLSVTVPAIPPITQQPVTLTLFVWQPPTLRRVESVVKDLPPPVGPLAESVLEKPERPIVSVPSLEASTTRTAQLMNFTSIWIGMFILYIVSIFVITRNALIFFPVYLVSLFRMWVPLFTAKHFWMDNKKTPLPFLGFKTTILREDRHFETRWQVSSVQGNWSLPFVDGSLVTLELHHPQLSFPAGHVDDSLHGIGVVLSQAELLFTRQTEKEKVGLATFVQESDVIVAPVKRKHDEGWWQPLLFVPRLFLLILFAFSLYSFWQTPTGLTAFLFFVAFWIALRDITVRLPAKLGIYARQ